MKQYFGLRPTGRQFKDSGSTLVELVDEAELKHTAIVLYDPFLEDADLGLNFRGVLSFLEYPMVTGLVELRHHDLLTGVFVYPTGPMWTMRELLRMAKDLDRPLGLRAALEIGVLGAEILLEASETGSNYGCFSHGSLNPWRLALKPDGELQVFGYGVPQVEVTAFLRDPNKVPLADALRYVPPERLDQEPEELASDTFALMVMVAEIATGRRVHDDQQTEALLTAVKDGETVRRVHKLGLSRPLAALFAKGVASEPDNRITGRELVEALSEQLPHAEGPSLDEVMEDVLGHRRLTPRRKSPLLSVPTQAVAKSDAPIEDRWAKPEPRPEPAVPDPTSTGLRRRRRPGGWSDPGDPEPTGEVPREPTAEEAPPELPPEPRTRRRSRTGTFTRPTPIGDRVPAPPGEAPASAAEEETTGSRRRRRQPRMPRNASEVDPTEVAPVPRRSTPRVPRARSAEEAPASRPEEDAETEVSAPPLPLPPRERRGSRPPGHDASPDDAYEEAPRVRRRRRAARRDDDA